MVEHNSCSLITELFAGSLQLIQIGHGLASSSHHIGCVLKRGCAPKFHDFHGEEISQWVLVYITYDFCIIIHYITDWGTGETEPTGITLPFNEAGCRAALGTAGRAEVYSLTERSRYPL